jgi:hypothetical protein
LPVDESDVALIIERAVGLVSPFVVNALFSLLDDGELYNVVVPSIHRAHFVAWTPVVRIPPTLVTSVKIFDWLCIAGVRHWSGSTLCGIQFF